MPPPGSGATVLCSGIGKTMKPSWQHFSHPADIGIRGFGNTIAEAFENAGVALCGVVTDTNTVRAALPIDISVSAPDIELLFVDWINELVYQMAVRKMLFSRFAVRIEGNTLYAKAWGEVVDPDRHRPAVEIKGATYTELSVGKKNDGLWVAECVVDV